MMTNTELFGSVDTEAVPTATGAGGDDSGSPLGQNTLQKYQKYVMRGSALMFIPFTSGFPAGLWAALAETFADSHVLYFIGIACYCAIVGLP